MYLISGGIIQTNIQQYNMIFSKYIHSLPKHLLTLYLLSCMTMCLIQIKLYYFVYEDKLYKCLILNVNVLDLFLFLYFNDLYSLKCSFLIIMFILSLTF